ARLWIDFQPLGSAVHVAGCGGWLAAAGKRLAGTSRSPDYDHLSANTRRIYHRGLHRHQHGPAVEFFVVTTGPEGLWTCYQRRGALYEAGTTRDTASEIPLLGRRDCMSCSAKGGRRSKVPRMGASTPFAWISETKWGSTHNTSINLRCPAVSTCKGRI